MNSKEAKLWIIGILIVVIACGGYFYVSNQKQEAASTEPVQQQTENSTPAAQSNTPKAKNDTAFGITSKQVGENVTIQGTVTEITSGKGHTFPVIKDPSNNKTIKGALFNAETSQKHNKGRSLEDLQQERDQQNKLIEDARVSGQTLTFEGQVDEYKGDLEIIINKVY